MLSQSQIEEFNHRGFLVVPGALSEAWTEQLRAASDFWVAGALEQKRQQLTLRDHSIIENEHGSFVFSIEKLHDKGRIESLELLGHPAISGILSQLCGDEVIPTYEGLALRQLGDELETPWHQSVIEHTELAALAIEVMLDPMQERSGGYVFLPGSHRSKLDICEVQKRYENGDGALVVPQLAAGDLLLYHPMIAKRAPKNMSDGMLRKIEYWFRAPKLAEDDFFLDEWIAERKTIQPLSKWLFAKLHEGVEDDKSFADSTLRDSLLARVRRDLTKLYSMEAIYPAANFCLDFKTGQRIEMKLGNIGTTQLS